MIGPPAENLLALRAGETELDIACGNDAFFRRMVQLGTTVVGFDFSETFIEYVRKRTTEHTDRITDHVRDATDRAALLNLGEARFDAAVCTMAIMDLTDIEPLAETLPRPLIPGGRFVFSVLLRCLGA